MRPGLERRRHGHGGAEHGGGGLAQAVGGEHGAHDARGAVEGRRRGSRGCARRRPGRRGASRPRGGPRPGPPGPAEACTAAAPASTRGRGRQRREAARAPAPAPRWAGPVASPTSLHQRPEGGRRDVAGAVGDAERGRRPAGRRARRPPASQRGVAGAGRGPDDQRGDELGAGLLAGPRDRAEGLRVVEGVGGAHAARRPLSTAHSTKRRTTSGASGRSPHRLRAPTTTPTGVVPASRRTARRRSQGLSERASRAARAQRASSASSTRAPTSASAAAAAARSSVPTAVPHGNGARSRRVAST